MTIPALAQTFSAHLPICLAGGSAIALFAWALLRLGRGQSSGARFGIWLSALLAIGILFLCGLGTSGSNPVAAHSTVAARVPIELPASLASCIFAAWLGCCCLAWSRLGVGLWRIRRLRQTAVPVTPEQLPAALQETLARFRSVRRVTLFESERVAVPMAVGFFRPAIVMPSWLLRELAPAELNQVLLHELAHLERWDDWTNLLQKALGSILFFHPAVWWIQRKLSLEREHACDDFVLSRTEDPTAYARCLAVLAEKTLFRRSLALAQAAVGRLGPTARRVSRILHITHPGSARLWKPGLSLVAVFSFACLLYQGHAPALVAFQDKAPAAEAADLISQPVSPRLLAAQVQTAVVRPWVRTLQPASAVRIAKASPPRAARSSSTPYARNASLVVAAVHPGRGPQRARFWLVGDGDRDTIRPAARETFLLVIDSRQDTLPDGSAWSLTVWHVIVCSAPPPAQKAAMRKAI